MTMTVECRRCGEPFEIDVMEISGPRWNRCPHCNADTAADEEEEEDDGAN
jgi:hypothetical protein